MKMRWGILVGIFFAILSLYPQLNLRFHRGSQSNGAVAYIDYDEPAYAAYLQALIDGKPRKNNVYAGGPDPVEESALSLQSLPAYAALVVARAFGLAATEVFLYIGIAAAFGASLSVFWFLSKVVDDHRLAAVGTIAVLAFGALLAGNGFLKEITGFGNATVSMPFLRRFTPALAFPFLFLFFGALYSVYTAGKAQIGNAYALMAGAAFAVLLYSYLYLWTAAIVFAGCLCFYALVLGPRKAPKRGWLVLFGSIALSLLPYVLLIIGRVDNAGAANGLERTRSVVLFKPSIILGVILIGVIAVLLRKRLVLPNEPKVAFAIVLAALPMLLFNQQVMTGYALQPFHYGLYVANYSSLASTVILAGMILQSRRTPIRSAVYVAAAILCGSWAVVESVYAANYRLPYNIRRDQGIPVARRLAALGLSARPQMTLNLDPIQADDQPALAPAAVLWADHLRYVTALRPQELRYRYFTYLFFQDIGPSELRADLEQCPVSEACRDLFGWRTNPTLSIDPHPPTSVEIQSIVDEYSRFTAETQTAIEPPISIDYLVSPPGSVLRTGNLARWFELDEGEEAGDFTLYRTRARRLLR